MKIYEAYKDFGVHKINKDLYQFKLYAPNAKSVSLIGDFNNWKPVLMKLNNEKIWEIILPAKEYQEYQYIITSLDNKIFYKIDPFSFIINNNHSVIYDYQNLILKENKIKVINEFYSEPLNIYEIYLGGWSQQYKNYKELAKPLVHYLKEYSFNAIQIMPITEYPEDKTWGYQPMGYFAPTNRYGTPEDLIYFIDYCHKNNIYVILDWVPAHFDPDPLGLINFDGQFLYEFPEENFRTHPVWKTQLFNWSDPYVLLFLLSSANFWLDVYKFDGLRIDTITSLVQLFELNDKNEVINIQYNANGIHFCRILTSLLKVLHPNIVLIAEETSGIAGITNPNNFNFSYKQALGWSWDTGTYIYSKHIEDQIKNFHCLTYPLTYFQENKGILTYGHDQIAKNNGFLLHQFDNSYDLYKVFYSYYIAFPGKKCIFMGNEYAEPGYWDHSKDLNFIQNDNQKNFSTFVKNINQFYLLNPALYEKDYELKGIEIIENNSDNQVLGFIRYSNEQDILCLFNFSNNNYTNYSIYFNNSYKNMKEVFTTHLNYNFNYFLNTNSIQSNLPPYSSIYFELDKI